MKMSYGFTSLCPASWDMYDNMLSSGFRSDCEIEVCASQRITKKGSNSSIYIAFPAEVPFGSGSHKPTLVNRYISSDGLCPRRCLCSAFVKCTYAVISWKFSNTSLDVLEDESNCFFIVYGKVKHRLPYTILCRFQKDQYNDMLTISGEPVALRLVIPPT